jgi:hypothetical protein
MFEHNILQFLVGPYIAALLNLNPALYCPAQFESNKNAYLYC